MSQDDLVPRGFSRRTRLLLFAVAAVVVVIGMIHVGSRMPHFGAHPLPYGDLINATAVAERHVTNMTSAINFDYRGFDTIGEEFMLLCAVTGVTVLLRGERGEATGSPPGRSGRRPVLPRTDAVALVGRLFASGLVLFGIYIVLHAMTTPGGGFQGGVIIATAGMLIFLSGGYALWRSVIRGEAMDACEGLGATLYALCGFAGLAFGRSFGENVLPLGKTGDLFSGGLMLVENVGVALAVTGGFLVIFIEFLEETRTLPEDGEDDA